MRVELKKEAKSCAIVSYGTRISLSGVNVRIVDMLYLRDYLLKVLGRSKVDFVSLVAKNDEPCEYYKDIRDVNLNDYDEVIIYNSIPNVFGGVFKGEAIQTFIDLYNYNGDLWYFFCEQLAFPCDVSRLIKYKQDYYGELKTTWGVNNVVTQQFCDDWREKVYKGKMKVMFVGNDYDKYTKRYNDIPKKGKYISNGIREILDGCDWAIVPLFEYYSCAEELEAKRKQYPHSGREFDLVYYGNQRAGKRNRIIANLYDREELNTYFIGYEPNFKKHMPVVAEYVNHDKLFPELGRAYATVVLCSESHNDIIKTPRFFEALNLDLVAFIWHEYDTEKVFIENEELKDFIYIKSYEELKEKLDMIKNDEKLFRHIIELEQKEAERLYNWSLNLYK